MYIIWQKFNKLAKKYLNRKNIGNNEIKIKDIYQMEGHRSFGWFEARRPTNSLQSFFSYHMFPKYTKLLPNFLIFKSFTILYSDFKGIIDSAHLD